MSWYDVETSFKVQQINNWISTNKQLATLMTTFNLKLCIKEESTIKFHQKINQIKLKN